MENIVTKTNQSLRGASQSKKLSTSKYLYMSIYPTNNLYLSIYCSFIRSSSFHRPHSSIWFFYSPTNFTMPIHPTNSHPVKMTASRVAIHHLPLLPLLALLAICLLRPFLALLLLYLASEPNQNRRDKIESQ